MIKVGITGGIGSGKTTVCKVLAVLGVPIFDADTIGKELLNNDPDLRAALSDRFGPGLYGRSGLDRRALGAVVFNDPVALTALNGLVHPAVRSAFHSWTEEQHAPYVVMEAAILAETGGHVAFDRIVVVSAPEKLRIQRVMARDHVDGTIVRARLRNQATEEERLAIAHHVIINDDRELVIPQVLALHEALRKTVPS